MNAIPDLSTSELNFVLKQLYVATRGAKGPTKSHEATITCRGRDPEDLNAYLEALESLKKDKVIEKYKKYSDGQEKLDDEDQNGYRETVYFLKLTCWLKPKVLIGFLIETSRIPKFTLAMDGKRRLILNGKYIISTPQFNSENFYFIDYCLKHPGEVVTKEALEKTSCKIKKRFHSILENLKLAPNLNGIFFLGVAADAAEFRNGVTTKDLIDLKIDERKISKFVQKLPVI